MRIKLSKRKFRKISIIYTFIKQKGFVNSKISLHITCLIRFPAEKIVLIVAAILSTLNGNSSVHSAATLTELVHLFCPKISKKTKFYEKYFPQFWEHHNSPYRLTEYLHFWIDSLENLGWLCIQWDEQFWQSNKQSKRFDGIDRFNSLDCQIDSWEALTDCLDSHADYESHQVDC